MQSRKLFWFNKAILVLVFCLLAFQLFQLATTTMAMDPDRSTRFYFMLALLLLFTGLEHVRAELEKLRSAIGAKDEAEIRQPEA